MAEVQGPNDNQAAKPKKEAAPTPKDQPKPAPGETIDHQDNNYTTPDGKGRLGIPEQPKKS